MSYPRRIWEAYSIEGRASSCRFSKSSTPDIDLSYPGFCECELNDKATVGVHGLEA